MAPGLTGDFGIFQICIKNERAGDRGQKLGDNLDGGHATNLYPFPEQIWQ